MPARMSCRNGEVEEPVANRQAVFKQIEVHQQDTAIKSIAKSNLG
jgi:hypothetical protein